MWTNRDYDNLKTMKDFQQQLTELFADTSIPVAVQTDVFNWFFFRKVTDNDRFVKYFNRKCRMVSNQFNQYLRVETTVFDPMVMTYLEHLTTSLSTVAMNKASTNVDERTQGNTTTNDQTTNGVEDTTVIGLHATTYNDDKKVTTTDSTAVTASNGTDTTSDKVASTRSMQAQLPQSAVGSSNGLPAKLNWTYATQQDENAVKDGIVTNVAESQRSDTQVNGFTDNVATGKSNLSISDEDSRKRNEEIKAKIISSLTANSRNTQNTADSGTTNELIKDIQSGRSISPQELLNKARNYIVSTNAFAWLVSQLEDVFMTVYE